METINGSTTASSSKFSKYDYYLMLHFKIFKRNRLRSAPASYFHIFDERDVVLQLVAFVDVDAKTGFVTIFACAI